MWVKEGGEEGGAERRPPSSPVFHNIVSHFDRREKSIDYQYGIIIHARHTKKKTAHP